ncbi:MAG: aminopeptidase [Deltaproteobacteria bacterium]|nr:aminopeptidase [Deltaproteobacteria bacterium]
MKKQHVKYKAMIKLSGLVPLLFIIMLLLAILSLTGCRTAYLWQAMTGQAGLLRGSLSRDDPRLKTELSAADYDKLAYVAEVVAFARQELGLARSTNYQKVYPRDQGAVIYVLSAAPRDQLVSETWWFPVVGRMGYLGFFDKEMAVRYKKELDEAGLDTHLRTALAYSTLGWFNDPITRPMLGLNKPALADLIIHELTHVTLYVKDQTDFNEGLANFVGQAGAIRFFQARREPESVGWLEQRAVDETRFVAFLDQLTDRLKELYSKSPRPIDLDSKKREIITAAQAEVRSQAHLYVTPAFSKFGEQQINNAVILGYSRYHQSYPLFRQVFERQGNDFKKFLTFFVQAAKENNDLMQFTREWVASHQDERP